MLGQLRHFIAILLAAIPLTGCIKPAGVIFPPLAEPIIWPQSPETPRISYVGQLITSADLAPAVTLPEAMGQAIFGKGDTYSMLTPYALCTDGKDRLFVTDSNAQLVHVFDLRTRKYAQWKPGKGLPPFSQPVGIAWDPQGTLFVADSVGGRIYAFDTNGKVKSQIAGELISRPCGLTFHNETGQLVVADAGFHQVIVLKRDGTLVTRIGTRGTALGQFNYPTNVAIDQTGRLFVSDSLNFRIQVFAPDQSEIKQIGTKGDLPGYFGQPKGIALDSQDHLYVVDANFETVQIFDFEGRLMMDFGHEGTGPGEFWLPAGIFIDPKNRIWIADSYNRRVQVMDYLAEKTP